MTFLWHDYETWGTNPAYDRPAQFAAQRTDEQLDPVGEPLVLFCRPPRDALPHPGASLVTGLTPQRCERDGVREAEFAAAIHEEMMQPKTCAVGYNSLKFDDQVSRHLFYRNFLDPYEREWRHGNSRWDLIGLARMCYALRPEGLEWPMHESGRPSFRLQDLAAANEIDQATPHEALADVLATIGLARLLRRAQPRLFRWSLALRDAGQVARLLSPDAPTPVLHSSGRISASRGCTTLVLPLAAMPGRAHWVIVTDLMGDPEPLIELDAADIADRVFTPTQDLPEEVQRIPLKTIAHKHSPMVAPPGVLRGVDTQRIGLDPERCNANARRLLANLPAIRDKLREVYAGAPPQPDGDPDGMLYSGGFFPDRDKRLMSVIRATPPEQLGAQDWGFEDPRLPEMLLRYRGRNWPDTLNEEEFARWEEGRLRRLREPGPSGRLDAAAFRTELVQARKESARDGAAQGVLDQLEAWALGLLEGDFGDGEITS